jgi:uncharacterized membrane protein
MSKKEAQLLDVLVATYNNVGDAEADLKRVREIYNELGTSHNFDAAVISKTKKGKVKIDKTYEAGKRHEALKGLGFGLAAGLAAAIFPPVGIGAAVAAGGAGGAAIGALVGHVQSGLPRGDLKAFADLLDPSEAALIVVYETNLADQMKKNVKAVKKLVRQMADLKADEIADEIRQAHAA